MLDAMALQSALDEQLAALDVVGAAVGVHLRGDTAVVGAGCHDLLRSSRAGSSRKGSTTVDGSTLFQVGSI